jgi:hypothetical protein
MLRDVALDAGEWARLARSAAYRGAAVLVEAYRLAALI